MGAVGRLKRSGRGHIIHYQEGYKQGNTGKEMREKKKGGKRNRRKKKPDRYLDSCTLYFLGPLQGGRVDGRCEESRREISGHG